MGGEDGVRDGDSVQVEEETHGLVWWGWRRVEKHYNELNQSHAYSTQCQAVSKGSDT